MVKVVLPRLQRVLKGYALWRNMAFRTLDMKTILIGLVIGFLLGASGIYVVNQSKISQLNKQMDAFELQVEQLNEVISSKQEIIDSQEDALKAVEALQNATEAKDTLIAEYEKLIDELLEKYKLVNIVCARQTYRAEKALYLLHEHLPEYEPEDVPRAEFISVFGDLSFTEWWELYNGPFEEWYQFVYP